MMGVATDLLSPAASSMSSGNSPKSLAEIGPSPTEILFITDDGNRTQDLLGVCKAEQFGQHAGCLLECVDTWSVNRTEPECLLQPNRDHQAPWFSEEQGVTR